MVLERKEIAIKASHVTLRTDVERDEYMVVVKWINPHLACYKILELKLEGSMVAEMRGTCLFTENWV